MREGFHLVNGYWLPSGVSWEEMEATYKELGMTLRPRKANLLYGITSEKERPNGKLNEEMVTQIWHRLMDGVGYEQLAKEYGTSKLTILRIKKQKRWKELTDTL
jgi:DNA invertase Pin-like site-specific DNA recombinase